MSCEPTIDHHEIAWCATHGRAVAECIAKVERERDARGAIAERLALAAGGVLDRGAWRPPDDVASVLRSAVAEWERMKREGR